MPDRLVISNTSPILYLHQVGHLDLLWKLYGQVQIPQAVDEELRAGARQGIALKRGTRFSQPSLVDPIELRSATSRTSGAGAALFLLLRSQAPPAKAL